MSFHDGMLNHQESTFWLSLLCKHVVDEHDGTLTFEREELTELLDEGVVTHISEDVDTHTVQIRFERVTPPEERVEPKEGQLWSRKSDDVMVIVTGAAEPYFKIYWKRYPVSDHEGGWMRYEVWNDMFDYIKESDSDG